MDHFVTSSMGVDLLRCRRRTKKKKRKKKRWGKRWKLKCFRHEKNVNRKKVVTNVDWTCVLIQMQHHICKWGHHKPKRDIKETAGASLQFRRCFLSILLRWFSSFPVALTVPNGCLFELCDLWVHLFANPVRTPDRMGPTLNWWFRWRMKADSYS